MPVTADTIESFFGQYDWGFEQVDENHFITGFKSESGLIETVTIHVTLTPSWVYFAIAPLIDAPANPECERHLYKHLLRLCHVVNLAKFSVDSDGDVIMTVELPRENLSYSEFADALNALSYYADKYLAEIQALATDPTAVSSLSEEAELDWGD